MSLNKHSSHTKQTAKKALSRRQFLKRATATTAGAALLGKTAPSFSAPDLSGLSNKLTIKAQKKALVLIMLDGGNDSFNMLVPTSTAHFNEYKTTRGNLALAQSSLLLLNDVIDSSGRTFGLHPSMPEIQTLFNNQKLAFIANAGPMVEPTNKSNFKDGSAELPLGLFSHADQFKHWQTAQANTRINLGWFGRMADALQPDKADSQIPMGISLAGNNLIQNGNNSSAYAITQKGSVGLAIKKPSALGSLQGEDALNNAIYNSFVSSLNANQGSDPFKQTYQDILKNAQLQHETFQSATANIASTHFSDTPLSQQLKKVAQSIQAADQLGHKQQTYFLRYIGWDHHDELLNNHQKMLGILSKALSEFQTALETAGIDDQVVTFTGSDFGRTLTSNGNGSDHAWGGNMMIMGNAVNGGQIYGDYPQLSLGEDNPLDVGNGVLIPTTAIETVYAELATWFGLAESNLGQLFPNLSRFDRTPMADLLSIN